MLGMEDTRVKEHLIGNSVKITSWNQMREEILEITRTQQYVDSQPMPMQLGANPKSKDKGKESKGKGQGCEKRIVQQSEKSDDRKSVSTATEQATWRPSAIRDWETLPRQKGTRWQCRHIHTTQQRSLRKSGYSQARDTRQRLSEPWLVWTSKRLLRVFFWAGREEHGTG